MCSLCAHDVLIALQCAHSSFVDVLIVIFKKNNLSFVSYYTSIGSRTATDILVDPRLPEDRNRPNLQSDIQNRTTAFCLYSGLDLAMRYTYGKANLQVFLDP